jgi:hypothetical protein
MRPDGRRPKVAVVVPVYNPGPYIDPLITSLAAQTMPQSDFEIVFVDDGSTDDTPAVLDRLAAEWPNVTVVHEANSGWPGRPRNVGIETAGAEYILFVDHDDWIGEEALERMTRFADDHGSDIVIGRQAGHHRTVAKPLFERTLPEATLDNAPLMTSLTPHMMFRKAFLEEHRLRFPEGRRRLEDHVFSTRAYFLARKVSVLADYHCYFHIRRPDDGNAAYQRIDPAGYYANVREVVDVVLQHTAPGWARDETLRRSLRSEVLGRVTGRAFLEQQEEYQRQLFDEARAVAVETMPTSVDAGLASTERVAAELLRAGRFEDLRRWVAHNVDVGAELRLLDVEWDDGGGLTLSVTGELVHRDDGRPWQYVQDDGTLLVEMPSTLSAAVGRAAAGVRDEVASSRLQIVARRRADSQEWTLPGRSSFTLHTGDGYAWVTHQVEVRLDPLTLGGGRPLDPGEWDFYGRIQQSGWVKERRLGADRAPTATEGARIALLDARLMAAYWTTPFDNLSLHVAAGESRLVRQVHGNRHAVTLGGSRRRPTLRLDLPLVLPLALPLGTEATGRLRLTHSGSGEVVDLAGRITRIDPTRAMICVALPGLRRGDWQIAFALDVDNWPGMRPTGTALLVGLRRTRTRAG